MWKNNNREEFAEIVKDLLADPKVQALAGQAQHSKNCSRLDHSLYVAYLSFLACRRLKLDYVSATRAALLHDCFVDDPDESNLHRIWNHPHQALANAEEVCELNDLERDIIVKHMWPLTRPLPRHRESFVVSMADKFCATMEFSYLYKLMRVRKHLSAEPAVA